MMPTIYIIVITTKICIFHHIVLTLSGIYAELSLAIIRIS
jgi:hypothetical protein